MGYKSAERNKESVHIVIDKEIFKALEKLRKRPHYNALLARSDVYSETLFYGSKVQELKKELGEKEFDRVWALLFKLNLRKVDLEKVM